MRDGPAIGDAGEDGGLERQAAARREPAPGGQRLSRRRFLAGAAAGAAAVGIGSMTGYWAAQQGFRLPALAAGATPAPSSPSGLTRTYRSRPDLSSPLVSVTTPGLQAASGLVLLTPHGGPALAVDNSGAPIWIHPTPGKLAFNLRQGTYKGAPVLSWFEGAVTMGVGQGEYVLVDQSYREITRVQAGNGLQGDLHEFITTPEGTALFTAYRQRPWPGSTPGPSPTAAGILESCIQEVDIASGRVLFEWHSTDYVNPYESYQTAPTGQPFDYFHINSIDVDRDGNLLISARHTWAVYKIDRRSGEVIWRLGGKRSDFAMGPGAGFAWQHDARRQADGSITLFDDGSNGSKPPSEDHSRGIVLEVKESSRGAILRKAYGHASPLSAGSQGSTQILPNGNVLVGWGDQPYYTEFTAGGDVVLDARLPDNTFSYRAYRAEWHGRPAEQPAVALEAAGGGATTVYASWNGATDVAVWVVLGGDTASELAPLGSRPWAGFETAIVVPGRPALMAVRALDGSGATLTQSTPIET
jgi:hypothetical protein